MDNTKQTLALNEHESSRIKVKIECDTESELAELDEVNFLKEKLETANKIINSLTLEVNSKHRQLKLWMHEHALGQHDITEIKAFQPSNSEMCYSECYSYGGNKDFISNRIKIENDLLGGETEMPSNRGKTNTKPNFTQVNQIPVTESQNIIDVKHSCSKMNETESLLEANNCPSTKGDMKLMTQLPTTELKIENFYSSQRETQSKGNTTFDENWTSVSNLSQEALNNKSFDNIGDSLHLNQSPLEFSYDSEMVNNRKDEMLSQLLNMGQLDNHYSAEINVTEDKLKLLHEELKNNKEHMSVVQKENASMKETLESRIESLGTEIITLQESNACFKLEIVKKEGELSALKNQKELERNYCTEIQAAEDKLKLLHEELKKEKEQMCVVQKENASMKETLESRIESLGAEINDLQESNAVLKHEMVKKEGELSELQDQKELERNYCAEIQAAEDNLKLLHEELKKEKEQMCVVQKENASMKETLESRIESLGAEINDLQESNAVLKHEMVKKEGELSELQDQRELERNYCAEIQAAEDKLKLLHEELKKEKEQMCVVQKENASMKETLESRIESLGAEVSDLQESNAVLKHEIANKEGELSEHQNQKELERNYCAEIQAAEDKLKLLYEELTNEKEQMCVVQKENASMKETFESRIESLGAEIITVQESNAGLKHEIANEEGELSEHQNQKELERNYCAEIQAAEDKLKLLHEELKKRKEQMCVVQKENASMKETLESRIESLGAEINDLQESNAVLNHEMVKKEGELSELQDQRELERNYCAEIQASEDKLKLLHEELKKEKEQMCVVQKENASMKETLESRIESLGAEIITLQESNAGLKHEIANKEGELSEHQNQKELERNYCAEIQAAEDKLKLLHEELKNEKEQMFVVQKENASMKETLESRIESLGTEINDLQESNAVLKHEMVKKEGELSELQDQRELERNYCAEIQAAEDKLKLVLEELKKEKEQMSVVQKENANMKETLESRIESLGAEINDLQESNAVLKHEMVKKEGELSELQDQRELERNYCAEIQASEDKLKLLHEELKKEKEQMCVVQKENASMKETLESRIESLGAEIITLQESNAGLKHEIANKEGELSEHQNQKELERNFCAEIQAAEDKLKLLHEELKNEKEQMFVVQKENASMKETLESRIESLGTEINDLQESNAVLKHEMVKKEGELSELQDQRELERNYCAEIQASEDNLKLLLEELKNEKEQMCVVQKENASMKETLESRIESLGAEINDLQESNAVLKHEMFKKEGELSELQDQRELERNYCAEIQASEDKLKLLHEELKKEKEQMCVVQKENASMKETLESRIESLGAEIITLQESNAGLKHEIANKEGELSEHQNQKELERNFCAEIQAAEDKLKLLHEELKKEKEQMSVVQKENASMKETFESRIESLGAEISDLQESNAVLKPEMVKKEGELSELQDQKELERNYCAEIQAAEDKLKLLREELKNEKEQMYVVQKENASMKETLESRIESLGAEIIALQESNVGLKVEIAKKEEKLSELQKELEKNFFELHMVDETKSLNEVLVKDKEQLISLEQGKVHVDESLESLHAKMIVLQESYASLKLEIFKKEEQFLQLIKEKAVEEVSYIAQIESLNLKVQFAEGTMKSIREHLGKGQSTSVKELKSDLEESLENYVVKVTTAIAGLQESNNNMKFEYIQKEQKIMCLEERVSSLIEINENLKINNFQKELTLSQLQEQKDAEIRTLFEAITSLEFDLKSVNKKNDLLSKELIDKSEHYCREKDAIMKVMRKHIDCLKINLCHLKAAKSCLKREMLLEEKNILQTLWNGTQKVRNFLDLEDAVTVEHINFQKSSSSLETGEAVVIAASGVENIHLLAQDDHDNEMVVSLQDVDESFLTANEGTLCGIENVTLRVPHTFNDPNPMLASSHTNGCFSGQSSELKTLTNELKVTIQCLPENNQRMSSSIGNISVTRSHEENDLALCEDFVPENKSECVREQVTGKENTVVNHTVDCTVCAENVEKVPKQFVKEDGRLCGVGESTCCQNCLKETEENYFKNLLCLRKQIELLNNELMYLKNENKCLNDQLYQKTDMSKELLDRNRQLEHVKNEHASCAEKICMLNQDVSEALTSYSKAVVSSCDIGVTSNNKSNPVEEIIGSRCECSTMKNDLASAKVQINNFDKEIKLYSKTLREEIKCLDVGWNDSEHNLNDLLSVLLNCVLQKQIEVFQSLEKEKCQCEKFSVVLQDIPKHCAGLANQISHEISLLNRKPSVCESAMIKLLSDIESKSCEITLLLEETDRLQACEKEKLNVEQKFEGLQKRVEYLQKKHNSKTEEIEHLHSLLRDSQERIDSVCNELQSNFHFQELLKNQIKETEESLAVINQNNFDLVKELDSKGKENNELRKIVANHDEKIETLVKELDNTSAKNLARTAECNRLSTENFLLVENVKEMRNLLDTEKTTACSLLEKLSDVENKLGIMDHAKQEEMRVTQFLQEQLLQSENCIKNLKSALEQCRKKVEALCSENEMLQGCLTELKLKSEKHAQNEYHCEDESLAKNKMQNEIDGLKNENSKLNAEIKELKCALEKMTKDYHIAARQSAENCDGLTKEIKDLCNKNSELIGKLKTLEDSCTLKCEKYLKKLAKHESENLHLPECQTQNQKVVNTLQLELENTRKKASDLDKENEDMNQYIKELQSNISAMYEEQCRQNTSQNETEFYMLKKENEELIAQKNENFRLQECLAQNQNVVNALEVELENARKKASDLDKENEDMNQYIKELQSNISAMYEEQCKQNTSKNETEIAVLKNKNEELNAQKIENLHLRECLTHNEKAIRALQIELEEAHKKASDLDKENEDMNQYIKELQSNLNVIYEQQCKQNVSQNETEIAAWKKKNDELIAQRNEIIVCVEELKKKCAVLERKALKIDCLEKENSVLKVDLAKMTKAKNIIDKQFQKLMAEQHRREFWSKTVTTVGTNTEVEENSNGMYFNLHIYYSSQSFAN
ncbi:hypothetical protein PR048_002727 [Dryococelus australis]|uniref:Centromere protein F n=1 Tax=Dryococelus australis TaxID=614101 RepID=A0ABQ9IM35_9NEOP|nr:hypothetical protein PR048_002727 [Dryococelus australis]